MQALIDILKSYEILSEQAINAFVSKTNFEEHSKGTILLKQGEYCKNIYLIKKGFARGFYLKNGKDITTWFAKENDILTSLYAFITQKQSFESIELLDSTSLYRISYENLQSLYREFPEINTLGRLLTENYYVELEERTLSLQFDSAKKRYSKLLETQPSILQKSSLGQIASYLGMSQETLSRIRGNI
jgi:CRP-like cAMP-binding protein